MAAKCNAWECEALGSWLEHYRMAHRDELAQDAEFTRWLEEDYAPIAGAWHY